MTAQAVSGCTHGTSEVPPSPVSSEEVDGMQTAWPEAVVLHVRPWTRPCAPDAR
jgi:hypothetical protein